MAAFRVFFCAKSDAGAKITLVQGLEYDGVPINFACIPILKVDGRVFEGIHTFLGGSVKSGGVQLQFEAPNFKPASNFAEIELRPDTTASRAFNGDVSWGGSIAFSHVAFHCIEQHGSLADFRTWVKLQKDTKSGQNQATEPSPSH